MMNYILHIDTSQYSGSVCLAADGQLLQLISSKEQKDQASFLQPAIHTLLKEQGIETSQLKAVAVTAGPGSYTGLRVGMASAKGLCYALNIPLISISTFEVMTAAALEQLSRDKTPIMDELLCPMIDARRQEVFTAMLSKNYEFAVKPTAIILSADTFIGQLSTSKIFFYGSGSSKFQSICQHPNAVFITADFDTRHMISLSHQRFSQQAFSNLAYTEPFYGKEFYSPAKS